MRNTTQDSEGFAVNTLVKVDFDPHPLFFRILALDHSRNLLQVLSWSCTSAYRHISPKLHIAVSTSAVILLGNLQCLLLPGTAAT